MAHRQNGRIKLKSLTQVYSVKKYTNNKDLNKSYINLFNQNYQYVRV